MFASGLVGPGENSGARTSSFRCNITNYYFYFRLIAFVNSDILAELPGNAVAQAGGVADGETSGRTPRREVLYDRPQTRDCPYRNDARHDARSHAPDGCARTFAARVGLPGRLFSILYADRLHLLTRFRQHRFGFPGRNRTIDQKIQPVVAQFGWLGLAIDDGNGHRDAAWRGLASPLQQEARLRGS